MEGTKPKRRHIFGVALNRRSVVRWKIYLDRARMYLGLISFVMIAFMFLNEIKDQWIRSMLDGNKFLVYPIVMLVFIGFALILGRMDTKYGMRKEEMRNHALENPVTMEILGHLRAIRGQQEDA